ncbi:MAG: hypothetical protein OHK0011_19470 [Turneriella sp.]
MPDMLEKLLITFAGTLVSVGTSYIVAGMRARVVSAEESGRFKADFEHLKRTVEAQNEVIHERVSKMSEVMSATLDKLDARTIEILEKHAELRGIMLARSEKQ